MSRPSALPWRKPRHEVLLLALVALAALSPVYGTNPQDTSRLCLTQALVRGHLHNDGCFGLDKSVYKGHEYSDKAPGMSLLELPSVEAAQVPPAPELPGLSTRLWIVRVLSSGLAFLLCAFMVGRISEGFAPGFGGISLVAFALGTLMGPFAATGFDHVPSAALGFGAFLLAWRRRHLLSGLLAGAALLVEYEAGLILAILAVYVAFRGRRPLVDYIAGALPGAVLLGAYNWLAFGAPWHLSYKYVANIFETVQATGFFGIGRPHLYSIYEVFAGNGGLLVASPVLVAAGWGLVLLSREHRAEVIVCAAVTLAFLIVNFGYFLPYGGLSPGPRFLIPSLPFLALGLGPAFAWRPRLTSILAALSVITMTGLTLVWGNTSLRQTVWGEIARVPTHLGSSIFVQTGTANALGWLGPGRVWGVVAVALFATAAFAVAFQTVPWGLLRADRKQDRSTTGPTARNRAVLVLASVYLVVAADTCAVFAYPYGKHFDLHTSISAYPGTASPGQEVDFTLTVTDSSSYKGYGDVMLTIELAPGMRLLGPPSYERGSGCKGTTTLSCYLESLSKKMSTPVHFAVQITQSSDQTVTASVSSYGAQAARRASFTVQPLSGSP